MDQITPPRMDRPLRDEYADYFDRYVALVPDGDILATLESGMAPLIGILRRVIPGAEGFRYAAGKWTVRESLGHLIDTERILAYRGLRIARGDATPRAPFDQDLFVAAAGFDQVALAGLIDEFVAVRQSTVALFRHLPPAAWERRGMVGENPLTVRAVAWIIAGHQIYHERLFADRYGPALAPVA